MKRRGNVMKLDVTHHCSLVARGSYASADPVLSDVDVSFASYRFSAIAVCAVDPSSRGTETAESIHHPPSTIRFRSVDGNGADSTWTRLGGSEAETSAADPRSSGPVVQGSARQIAMVC